MSDTLEAIQSRADRATPGPWFREYSDVVTARPDPRDVEEGYEDPRDARVVRGAPHLPKKDRQGIADAEFIAHAPGDIHALLAIVREQAATLAAVRDLANSAGRCGWRISADDIRKTLGKP